jgi:dihydrofolate reductase
MDGGKTIQHFLQQGLVNEAIITRIPRLFGQSIPLFAALSQDIVLTHVNTRSLSMGLTQRR